MKDEQESATEDQSTVDAGQDQRFEVKWRKKSDSNVRRPDVEPVVPPPALEPSAAALQQELEAERERSKNLQEKWQRAAADLVNLRKRTEEERGEVEKFAGMVLVQQLLPVLDNFDRALTTIPGNLQMLTWLQGIMLIERHLHALLEQQGLKPIEAAGQPFSAHYHEAVAERETSDAAPGTVVQEYQRGYMMHGRVIRPTLVEVAKAAAADGKAEGHEPPDSADNVSGDEIAEEAEIENVGP